MTALAAAVTASAWRLRGYTGTTLVIRVAEADPAVELVAGAHHGAPAHLTLAYRFPLAAVGGSFRTALRQLFAGRPAFDVELVAVRRFDTVAYLEPESEQPFAALAAAVQDRFPGHPLYDGAFPTYIPHVSLGPVDQLTPAAEAAVGGSLPIRARVSEVQLWAMRRNWQRFDRFTLLGQ